MGYFPMCICHLYSKWTVEQHTLHSGIILALIKAVCTLLAIEDSFFLPFFKIIFDGFLLDTSISAWGTSTQVDTSDTCSPSWEVSCIFRLLIVILPTAHRWKRIWGLKCSCFFPFTTELPHICASIWGSRKTSLAFKEWGSHDAALACCKEMDYLELRVCTEKSLSQLKPGTKTLEQTVQTTSLLLCIKVCCMDSCTFLSYLYL